MKEFKPDYTNLIKAAKNTKPDRMPLYDHHVNEKVMEAILNKEFADLYNGNESDRREFFRIFNGFFKSEGYDTVSFERGYPLVMPGSGALRENKPGIIKDREDFERYPWDEIPRLYFEKFADDFKLLEEEMPQGMKAVGGIGYGLFEGVQDVVGYQELCYISVDDPELYRELFEEVGNVMYKIWKEFLDKFGDNYAVCRFGDDLGFKSSTLLPPDDIRNLIIPQYKKLVNLIHSYNKPFLLHSCGRIFDVMDDLIDNVKIDAKHSNEDQIAPFSVWVEKYGDRIGNFGGVDTDHLCRKSEDEIKLIVKEIVGYSINSGGFALGSGNSIPAYVKPELYLAMLETARELRGE